MKVAVVLVKSDKYNDDGYPIGMRVAHGSKKPVKTIGRAWPEHFSDVMQMVTEEHPDFDVLAPLIMDYKLKGRRLVLQNTFSDPAAAAEMTKVNQAGAKLVNFAAQWVKEQKQLRDEKEEKGEILQRNKIDGYVRSVENVLVQ